MFDSLLEKCISEDINEHSALLLLERSRDPSNALKLFMAASNIRDETMGKDLTLSAGIGGVLPCRIVPMCRYCTYHTKEPFDTDKLIKAVKVIESLGIPQVHLSGGTNLKGYDKEILSMVRAIKNESGIDIEINLGCSISPDTIRELKRMDVVSITSSLETINEDVFRMAKPGDSLEARKSLIEACDREGVPIRSMMLIGLGETYEDRIKHLFYLKRFPNLYHLRFSRFNPYPGTQYKDHPRCSPWELAITVAVARLILPKVNLGLAAGNSVDDIPLWYAAGGGNQLLGAHVSRNLVKPEPGEEAIQADEGVSVINRIPVLSRYIEGMGGRKIIFNKTINSRVVIQ